MKCECIGGLCCGGHGIKQREVLRQDSDRHQRALFSAVITLFDLEPPGESNATSTFAWANQQSTAASVIRRAQRPSSAQPPPTHSTPEPDWGAIAYWIPQNSSTASTQTRCPRKNKG